MTTLAQTLASILVGLVLMVITAVAFDASFAPMAFWSVTGAIAFDLLVWR